MDVQRETLRSLFDAVADSYDQVGVDFFQPIADGLVTELDPQPGERALDLGCWRGAALLRSPGRWARPDPPSAATSRR